MPSDTPRNIELFNRIVVLLLAKLYESFPVPVTIESGQLGAEATEGFTEDEEEIFHAVVSVAHETALFLREEGLLSFQGDVNLLDGKLHSARLTMKGLALLGRVPEQIDASARGESLGSQIRAAANRGASDYLASLVGQVVGASVGAGWRAFSAG
ncbi:hypothetical protein [Thermomonas haemolytica]|uniref:hypothetical protein n=1 Tax=Thermomonas haemolytica TaxID=141949 RepID=UPI000E0D3EA8|nr:hypothetical protein [Thermomonas haemolytica]TNY28540.1 hypothetical protein BV505_09825 [Thermomonas haemolytica]